MSRSADGCSRHIRYSLEGSRAVAFGEAAAGEYTLLFARAKRRHLFRARCRGGAARRADCQHAKLFRYSFAACRFNRLAAQRHRV